MSRLFTFGCSFTSYYWPTWADILSQDSQYTEYQNWGKVGGGNHYILYSLTEAIRRNKINSDDTIAIMWTSVGREDRYIRGKWNTPGSIYNSPISQKYNDYIKKFTDPDGYLMTNLSVIDSANYILDNIGCKSYQFKIVPFLKIDYSYKNLLFDLSFDNKLYELYKDSLDKINDSFEEISTKADWFSTDFNPAFLQESLIENVKDSYKKASGCDWPSFKDFYNDNYSNVSKEIYNEIEDVHHLRSLLNNTKNGRSDNHPSPIEHLNYLKDLNIPLSIHQHEYAQKWEEKVRHDKNFKFKQSIYPKRF